ncbi:MAG: hypothetical protein S4CHLAM37_11890 [Chlamydiia bacterium]|nr:hypothetical protein [Chlamydiia bacterium]
MSHNVEEVGAVSSVSKKSKPTLGDDLFHDKHVVQHISYAIIVMEVLNKVGLSHQQKVMQLRGKYMDVMTRMQNDFTTISQYLSQIENNSHSGGSYKADSNTCVDTGTNGFNGLDNSYYRNQSTIAYASGNYGDEGTLVNYKEIVSDSFKSSSQSFVNAVKDLFFGSTSGVGITVKDISKITNPHGGPNFNFADPKNNYWQTLSKSFEAEFGAAGTNMIMTAPNAHPSLLQQYMFYKTQVDIYTMPKSQVKAANGQVDKLENFDPTGKRLAGQAAPDSLLGTFMEMLSALNRSISVKRDIGWDYAMGCKTAPSILQLIQLNKMSTVQVPGGKYYHHWRSKSDDHGHEMHMNQLSPGLYQAVSMIAFNYFWTKNPNASTDSTVTNTTADSVTSGSHSEEWSTAKGVASSDPLSNMYMTTNSVQTNISQQSSQSNNNFQSDVSVAGQLDNMGVNATKSFFEGTSTMNRNSRIS